MITFANFETNLQMPNMSNTQTTKRLAYTSINFELSE